MVNAVEQEEERKSLQLEKTTTRSTMRSMDDESIMLREGIAVKKSRTKDTNAPTVDDRREQKQIPAYPPQDSIHRCSCVEPNQEHLSAHARTTSESSKPTVRLVREDSSNSTGTVRCLHRTASYRSFPLLHTDSAFWRNLEPCAISEIELKPPVPPKDRKPFDASGSSLPSAISLDDYGKYWQETADKIKGRKAAGLDDDSSFAQSTTSSVSTAIHHTGFGVASDDDEVGSLAGASEDYPNPIPVRYDSEPEFVFVRSLPNSPQSSEPTIPARAPSSELPSIVVSSPDPAPSGNSLFARSVENLQALSNASNSFEPSNSRVDGQRTVRSLASLVDYIEDDDAHSVAEEYTIQGRGVLEVGQSLENAKHNVRKYMRARRRNITPPSLQQEVDDEQGQRLKDPASMEADDVQAEEGKGEEYYEDSGEEQFEQQYGVSASRSASKSYMLEPILEEDGDSDDEVEGVGRKAEDDIDVSFEGVQPYEGT